MNKTKTLISLCLQVAFLAMTQDAEQNEHYCCLKGLVLIAFACFLNNSIHSLNQENPITGVIYLIFLIESALAGHRQRLLVACYYASALIQVIRMQGTRIYTKLRNVRIMAGPIYGVLLFWRLLESGNDKASIGSCLVSLLVYLVGVSYRPDSSEGNYTENRKTHGILMSLSFTITLTRDILGLAY